MTERAGDGMRERGTALKRRGLIAGAAALVAGMVAKRAAEESPVAADNGTWTFPYTGITNSALSAFSVANNGSGIGIAGSAAASNGVSGKSTGNHAVYGNLFAPTGSGYAAVYGFGNGDGTYGVVGDGYAGSGVGVLGQSNTAAGTGVKGVSADGFPVIGVATDGTNANAGVLGVGTSGPGVQGQSYAGHGLVGTTFATDAQHAGLIGTVQPGGNAIGLRGSVAAGATGLAGMFDGNVRITGTFVAPTMQAVVQHAGDKTARLLHTMAAPEGWFEDFGEGTLAGDKAQVTLDPDFAALVHTDAYHVFLTAHGPQHLHVEQRTAGGFSVVATAVGGVAGGPKPAEGGGTFAWRVVAKRKDIAGERLAKVAPPPPLKPVSPFTVPEPAEPKPPPKKP